jgi:hypothetical protein
MYHTVYVVATTSVIIKNKNKKSGIGHQMVKNVHCGLGTRDLKKKIISMCGIKF